MTAHTNPIILEMRIVREFTPEGELVELYVKFRNDDVPTESSPPEIVYQCGNSEFVIN